MYRSIFTAGVFALATIFITDGVVAQSSIDVEEIIVTSTKRARSLQDISVSVAVIEPAVLEAAQIVDILDLQTSVSSLRVTQLQQSSATNFLIRGFGNGANNAGIEGSVGVFIDGIYRNRSASNLLDLPDVERIEILRGPQSTLFGKNTSVGAISVITKQPEFEYGGNGELTYGNFNQYILKGAVTGPIGDGEKVAFRVSGSYNNRDGYYDNNLLGTDVNDRNRWGARAQFLVKPTEDLSFRLIGEWNKINEVCCGAVSIFNGPATQAIAAFMGKTITPDFFSGSGAGTRVVNQEKEPSNVLEGKGLSLNINYDAGYLDFTSITAWRKQSEVTDIDVDFTGADIVNQRNNTAFQTFTQEFRFASTGDDNTFDWLFGAFYMKDEVDPCCRTVLYGADTRAYVDILAQGQIGALEAAIGLPNGFLIQPGQGALDNWTLDTDTWSFFGEIDFNVTDRLTITGGAAYIDDKKKVTSNVIINDPFNALDFVQIGAGGLFQAAFAQSYAAFGVDASNPAAIAALEAVAPGTLAAITAGAQAFAAANATNPAFNPLLALQALQAFRNLNRDFLNVPNANEPGTLNGDETTAKLAINYALSDNLNIYASYATGWKAGAYNLSYDSTPPDPNGIGRVAQPEKSRVLELGMKASFDRGFLNVAIFDQQVKNFQENIFTGLAFALSNAGSETHKGIEIDGLWRPIDPLTLTASFTYLDAKYDSYERAACASFDVVNCSAGQRFRDISGNKVPGIHDVSFALAGVYTHDFTADVEGFARLEYMHESNVALVSNVPPTVNGVEVGTRGVDLWNASVGLNIDNGLQAVVWVRNATNDDYLLSAFPTVFQAGSFSGYVNPPRTFGLTLRQQF